MTKKFVIVCATNNVSLDKNAVEARKIVGIEEKWIKNEASCGYFIVASWWWHDTFLWHQHGITA